MAEEVMPRICNGISRELLETYMLEKVFCENPTKDPRARLRLRYLGQVRRHQTRVRDSTPAPGGREEEPHHEDVFRHAQQLE
jgi:hypothetical protein